MICSLHIKNIALIDELNIEFADGLNVLSGETGAGKTIIINAMNLVLGERADRDLIRTGQEKARVDAVFFVDKHALSELFDTHGIDEQDELIVSRELTTAGRNICRINGVIVPLNTLKAFMDKVVDIHGQHEHQSLLYAKNHLSYLDAMFHNSASDEIKSLYDQLKECNRAIDQIGGSPEEREKAIELLSYEINELEAARITSGEMDELKLERERLQNAQRISLVFSEGYGALYLGTDEASSVVSVLKNASASLQQITQYDERYAELQKRLDDAYYSLEECAHDLNAFSEETVFDAERQNEVEARVDQLNGLFRKFHVSDEDELLLYIENAQKQLDDLLHSGKRLTSLLLERERIQQALYKQYKVLSALRHKEAAQLEQKLIRELSSLGMKNAQFEVRFAPFPSYEDIIYNAEGQDEVEFYISVNQGEPLRPLSKTASGGEISRIMLALKNIASEKDQIGTIVFDEIDTGIGGQMAHVVAEKLAGIARFKQVICVTHLAQIAAIADRNFLISKSAAETSTRTTITEISGLDVLEEIARLQGGIVTEHSIAYAKELIENARQIKKQLPEEEKR
ncbi:MAG: DNA repair protein RecN [Christensenellaceae bacterium]|jgi:DNA repair protein RecN (Recombination protein N)